MYVENIFHIARYRDCTKCSSFRQTKFFIKITNTLVVIWSSLFLSTKVVFYKAKAPDAPPPRPPPGLSSFYFAIVLCTWWKNEPHDIMLNK